MADFYTHWIEGSRVGTVTKYVHIVVVEFVFEKERGGYVCSSEESDKKRKHFRASDSLTVCSKFMWPQLFLAGAGALGIRAGIRAAQRSNMKLPQMPDLSVLRGLEGFGGNPMSKAEAVRILNIAPQQALDAEKVREVHRRLLLANHPDRGGSTFLSTKINEAKETLMGKKK